LISNLREGPEELGRQLPISGETIDIRIGPDGLTYFTARLDVQVMHRLNPSTDTATMPTEHLDADGSGPYLWVRDIVMRASRPGEAPHYGMQGFPVDLAYILDLSYHDDEFVDFAKLLPIAAVDIDDLPDAATEPAPHQDGGLLAAALPARPDGIGGDTPVEPSSDDRRNDAVLPADGDDPVSQRMDLDDLPGAGPTTPGVGTPPDVAPVLVFFSGQPDHLEPQREPVSPVAQTVDDADEDTRVDALPDPATIAPASPSIELSSTAAPGAGEVTRPVRAATTARPSIPPADRADINDESRRPSEPPQGTPPAHHYPFGDTPTAPPPPPQHHLASPRYSSSWPDDTRSRSLPTLPAPPRHGMQPPPIIPTTPSRRAPSAKTLAVTAVVLVGVSLIGIAVWNVAGSDSDKNQTAAPTTAQAKPSEQEIQRLKSALPKGYSESACVADGSAPEATVTCGPNTDAGGPQTATYTLYADQRALSQAFTDTIATFDRVNCPGNIQSPGPWRRNAAPDTVAGTLFCGTRADRAAVVWTSDAQSLLNVAEAGAQGPSLDQLYAWWGTHS
jgi:hypothetical protein